MITPFAFGADRVDNVDTILAADINNVRAWLAYTAALGRNANTETLAANKTLVDADEPIQFLDPSASEYTVELPAEGLANHVFYFVNTSASYDLEILDDAAATIVTVEPEKAAIVVSDGTNWELVATTNAATHLTALRVYEANDTWTKPTGLDHVIVEVVGGGAGGGGCNSGSGLSAAAPGGGGGGYSKKFISAASLGATETVTVGAGGAGGAAGTNNGAAGGTSSFGSHLSATGGAVAAGGSASATVPAATSNVSTGGAGSNGDINANGSAGGMGLRLSTTSAKGGRGGDTLYGAGGRPTLANSALQGGSGYGGGGAGAATADTTTDLAGGDGADGVVIVYEYTS
jgi:hypothetical protein